MPFSLVCSRSSVGARIRRRLATDNELSLIMADTTLRCFASHLHGRGREREGVGGGEGGDLITVVQKNHTASCPSELMLSPNRC